MINEFIAEEKQQIDTLQEILKECDDMPTIINLRHEIGMLVSHIAKLEAIRDEVKRITRRCERNAVYVIENDLTTLLGAHDENML